ncbi:TonB-dependent receptor SusC precursor [mine drainage metagenome]|uniref:TonB-dependent receptor SusC n=1 Tax=mine drainage metagenome TaxID=410659 RepID=A0A1J5T1Y3_9ZZZZ
MKKNVPLRGSVHANEFLKFLLVMKLAILLTLFTAYQVQASVFGQSINVNAKQTEIKKILNSIERNGDVRFLYNYELASLKTKVDFKAENLPLTAALDKLFVNTELTYKILDNNLVVVLAKGNIAKFADVIKVTGKITGDNNEPLSGVSVLVKGTNKGTSTDNNGVYTISTDKNAVLVFSYIGYESKEVSVKGEQVVNVKLTLSAKILDQVVVVGYGVQRKSVVTGAIASVKAKDLEDMPVVRLEDALKGRTSGATIYSNSGQPGAASTVMIRGVTSINNFDPLYVVDGVPVAGGIDYLNAADIESIEVLKDAASAAIYGTKAASGVILVTTKKGKSGALQVNVASYYGVQSPAKTLKLLNATEYAALRNESSAAAGNGILFPDLSTFGKGTDWQNAIFNNDAKIQNHELSFSGGNEKSTFFASFGFFKQEGIVAPSISNYQRFSVRINSAHKVTKWLNFGENLSYAYTKSQNNFDANGYYGGPLSSAVNLDPITPIIITDPTVLAQNPYVNHASSIVKDAKGNPYGISPYVGQEMTNPAAYIQTHQGNYGWGDKIVANTYIEIEPVKGLKLKTSIGGDLAFWGSESFNPIYYLSATNSNLTNTSFNRNMNKAFNMIFTNTASYTRSIGLHNFSVLAGTEARKMTQFGVGASYVGLPVNSFGDASMNFTIPAANMLGNGYESQPYNISSLFGRVTYDYDGKYLFTGIIRRDGSSHFGSDNVYGNFPSMSAGWILTREKFWPANLPISFLKLRAGYGVNGNDNLSPFQYVSTVNGVGTYPIGGQLVTGNSPVTVANPSLKWEQTSQTDVAIDMVMFKDWNLTVDVFKKKTTGMLMQPSIPYYIGALQTPWANIGAMENNGIEIELGYKKKVGQVGLDFKGNVSYLKNKVTNLGNTSFLTYGNMQSSAYEVSRKAVGQPINSFYGFQTLGIFQTQAEVNNYVNSTGALLQPNARPGDFKWADLNGDGAITNADRTYLGDPTPHWIFGFTVGATYKDFDIRIFAQGTAGSKIFQQLRRLDIPTANYSTKALGRWTGQGTSNDFPRLIDSDPNGNFSNPSSFYLEDGSYLRIKTLQIGYNVPKKVLAKAKIQSARVYVSGNNLLTLTKYTGYDPEIGGTGGGWLYSIDRGIYPQARSFMAGVNFTF